MKLLTALLFLCGINLIYVANAHNAIAPFHTQRLSINLGLAPLDSRGVPLIKDLFKTFYTAKNMRRFSHFFANDFTIEEDGHVLKRDQFKTQQTDFLNALSSFRVVRYDDIFEARHKLAARMVVAIAKQDGKEQNYPVMLFVHLNHNKTKITKIWEHGMPW